MEQSKCKELSGLDCRHVVKAESPEAMLQKAMEHGKSVHGEAMSKMSDDEKQSFQESLKSKVYDVFS